MTSERSLLPLAPHNNNEYSVYEGDDDNNNNNKKTSNQTIHYIYVAHTDSVPCMGNGAKSKQMAVRRAYPTEMCACYMEAYMDGWCSRVFRYF